MSAGPRGSGSRKVPRIDYGKYRGGRAAGRREAVTVLGDSLRENGCVRVQGHPGGEGGETTAPGASQGREPATADAALGEVARGLLEGLAEYFGLPAAALVGAAAAMLAPVASAAATAGPGTGRELVPVPGLLLLVPAVPEGLAVRRGASGDWWEVAAHPGELLAVAGEALARLTAERVAAAGVRWPPSSVTGWLLPARGDRAVEPLAAFAGADERSAGRQRK